MFNKEDFDLWADDYDEDVGLSQEDNTYPFAGYKDVLGGIFNIIIKKEKAIVLDLGFGTGTLAKKLYEQGCTIYGQDFSSRMIELASEKMPDAKLYQGDFAQGLLDPLDNLTYDFIVATYSIHHLNDTQKIDLINRLLEHLNEGGQILIGDVAFKTRKELEKCRSKAGEEWDDEEVYCVAEELKSNYPNISFTKVSYCAGIISISR
ncbi:MAG: class I SAM-dependent methyltransferase [Erysipelotrichaceae bacterium]|nr:class I SAM-dependent methyltransferase [Erysipelotrichaceae bacterium]